MGCCSIGGRGRVWGWVRLGDAKPMSVTVGRDELYQRWLLVVCWAVLVGECGGKSGFVGGCWVVNRKLRPSCHIGCSGYFESSLSDSTSFHAVLIGYAWRRRPNRRVGPASRYLSHRRMFSLGSGVGSLRQINIVRLYGTIVNHKGFNRGSLLNKT